MRLQFFALAVLCVGIAACAPDDGPRSSPDGKHIAALPDVGKNSEKDVIPVAVYDLEKSKLATFRVSALVYQAGELDPALTDLVNVELSKSDSLEVLERSHVELIFKEWRDSAFTRNSKLQVRLGRLFGVDYFIFVSIPKDATEGTLEIANAQSSRTLVTERLKFPSNDFDLLARKIATRSEKLFATWNPIPPVPPNAVAFVKPIVQPSDEKAQAAADGALTALMTELHTLGVPLLHRTYVENVSTEHLWGEKGLTVARHGIPFLGARYLISARFEFFDQRSSISLIVLDTKSGRRIAQNSFSSVKKGLAHTLPSLVAPWLRYNVNPERTGTQGNKTRTPKTPKAELHPKVLSRFYRGIELYLNGQHFEAVDTLIESYGSDDRFLLALRWAQTCFEDSGFKELSQAIESHISSKASMPKRFFYSGAHNPKTPRADSGVNLLGVSFEQTVPISFRTSLTMFLIESLHEKYQSTVFLPEDISSLQREYDLLVGLDNTDGVRWESAPSFVYSKTLHARVYPSEGNLRIDISAIDDLDPKKFKRITFTLPQAPSKWKDVIQTRLDLLSHSNYGGVVPIQSPTEDENVLLKRVQEDCSRVNYLKLLTVNPSHIEFLSRYPEGMNSGGRGYGGVRGLQYGLVEWFARVIPKGHSMKGWADYFHIQHNKDNFADGYVSYNNPSEVLKIQERRLRILREFARKYPEHPAGLCVAYNTLLHDIKPENYAQSLEALSKVIGRFSKLDQREWRNLRVRKKVLPSMKTLEAILATALGHSPPSPARWRWPGRIFVGYPTGELELFATHYYSTDDFKIRGQEDASLFLELFSFFIKKAISVESLTRLFQELPDHKEVFRITNEFLHNPKQYDPDVETQKVEILGGHFAEFLVGKLSQETIKETPDYFAWLLVNRPRYRKQVEIQEALLVALEEGRFEKPGDLDLPGPWKYKDPKRWERILLKNADLSWDKDPITNKSWLAYVEWKATRVSKRELVNVYKPYLKRLHQRYRNAPKSDAIMKLYYRFAVAFFSGESYGLAEGLFRELLSWDWKSPRNGWDRRRPGAQFLLALLEHRNGNTPAALRRAQLALKEIGKDHDLILYATYGGGYLFPPLKTTVTNFISEIRLNPKAPFKNPFHYKFNDPYRWDR